MMHPHTELRFISEAIGHGVVATQDIPKGTITWVQDELDRELTIEQVESIEQRLAESIDDYCFRNRHGRWILCWDHARFVNHSFKSNCLMTALGFEIAIRDIKAGEELTDDYGALNVVEPFEAIDEGADRKVVYPDDLLRYHPTWDRHLREAWPHIPSVDQRLGRLLPVATWRQVVRIANGREPMPSIQECYFREDRAAVESRINGSTATGRSPRKSER